MNQIVLYIIKPELHGNNCYWVVKAIHNIALVMDFTTLLTDIWIYVESYVPLMSPNEDEIGLALLITSRESNSSSYNQPKLPGNNCYWEVEALHNIALVMDFTTLLTDIWIYVENDVPLMSPNEDEIGLALLITSRESNSSSYNQTKLHGNNCYWEVEAIHNIALVMDFTTLLTDIWIYVESYVPQMSTNEDETGLALLITSRESNSSLYNQARITRK